MAYRACASDGRSADAWTERAPILRGREGVKSASGEREGLCAAVLGWAISKFLSTRDIQSVKLRKSNPESIKPPDEHEVLNK